MSGRRSRQWLILLVLCVPLFMTMLDNTVVNTALPSIQRALHGGVSDLQWIVDGYSLGFASLMLSASTIGDLRGRKKTLVVGLLLFSAGSAVCALATSVGWLLGGRVTQGIGAAAVLPGTLSIIRHVFTDERERGAAIGVWAGVSGLGLGLGPLVGGLLTEHFHWPSVFWVNVPVGVLGVVAALLVIPESSDRHGRRMDLPGQFLAIVAFSAVVFATIEGPVWGWIDARVLTAFGVAAVSLGLFAIQEDSAPSPLLELRFLRDRSFSGAIIAGFAVYFGMFAVLYFLSLWLQLVLGWSPIGAGLAIMPSMVVVGVVSPLAGWISGRIGAGLPLALGLAVSAVTLYFFTWYGVGASYRQFWWLVPLVGLGMGLTLTPITTTVMSRVPPARSGMASATSNTARELGGVLGVAVLGSILSNRMGVSLAHRLAGQGVPQVVRDRIVTTAKSGGHAGAGLATHGGRIGDAIDRAFATGLHQAQLVGAGVLGVSALVTLILVRGRGQAEDVSDRPEQPVDRCESHA